MAFNSVIKRKKTPLWLKIKRTNNTLEREISTKEIDSTCSFLSVAEEAYHPLMDSKGSLYHAEEVQWAKSEMKAT